MREVVIVEAVRSPIGRRGGELSTMHSVDLLAEVQKAAIERSGIDPAEVGQVVGGCVSQVGMQAFNVARTAWLTAGMPISVAATTVDSPVRLVAAGHQPRHLARGQRRRRRRPRLRRRGHEPGARWARAWARASARPCPKSYFSRFQFTSQFQGAELIAQKWGITREQLDEFGKRSQDLAAQAWAEGRFEGQIVEIDAPDLDEEGKPTGTTHHVSKDGGLRETTLEGLAGAQGRRAARRPDRRRRGRSPHRRHLVADLRRRRRRAADGARARPRPSGCGPGPASSTPASSAATRSSCSPARSTPPSTSSPAPA